MVAEQPRQEKRVSFAELFFDLVFVFAVTQVSALLHHDHSAAGVAKALIVFVPIYWAWVGTTIHANTHDVDQPIDRVGVFAVALASLFMALAVPDAYGDRGLLFGAGYLVLRLLLAALVFRGVRNLPINAFSVGVCVTGPLLLVGGLLDGPARVALWATAATVDLLVPWLVRSRLARIRFATAHLPERFGLFIIIALGESILVTGAQFGSLPWTATTVASFLAAFVGSVAMWWIYFNIGAERASRHIAGSGDPGRVARLAYTYLHLPLVAGIILAAVGDELVLAHPTGHTEATTAAVLIGAPAIYLIGNLMFKRATATSPALSHMVGLGLLALLIPVSPLVQPLTFSAATTAVLVLVAAWETVSLGPGGIDPAA